MMRIMFAGVEPVLVAVKTDLSVHVCRQDTRQWFLDADPTPRRSLPVHVGFNLYTGFNFV